MWRSEGSDLCQHSVVGHCHRMEFYFVGSHIYQGSPTPSKFYQHADVLFHILYLSKKIGIGCDQLLENNYSFSIYV